MNYKDIFKNMDSENHYVLFESNKDAFDFLKHICCENYGTTVEFKNLDSNLYYDKQEKILKMKECKTIVSGKYYYMVDLVENDECVDKICLVSISDDDVVVVLCEM